MNEKCFFCGKSEQTVVCDICHISSYCADHEHIHKHPGGRTCYPWRVETMEGVGRVVMAERDIKCHEIVLDDEPVGVSPTQVRAATTHHLVNILLSGQPSSMPCMLQTTGPRYSFGM